jgi:hypothetical protein
VFLPIMNSPFTRSSLWCRRDGGTARWANCMQTASPYLLAPAPATPSQLRYSTLIHLACRRRCDKQLNTELWVAVAAGRPHDILAQTHNNLVRLNSNMKLFFPWLFVRFASYQLIN